MLSIKVRDITAVSPFEVQLVRQLVSQHCKIIIALIQMLGRGFRRL